MTLKEAFENTIRSVFSDEIWEGENLQKKYKKVLKGNGDCGKFGDDSSTIDLMLYIRNLMRINNLVPNLRMDNTNIEEFINKKIREKDNWLTKEYKESFPKSYNSEPNSHLNGDYDVDGWNYENAGIIDWGIEWIGDYKGYKNTHYYYNELDHYLTYLVGAIRRGKLNDCIHQGHMIKKDIFED